MLCSKLIFPISLIFPPCGFAQRGIFRYTQATCHIRTNCRHFDMHIAFPALICMFSFLGLRHLIWALRQSSSIIYSQIMNSCNPVRIPYKAWLTASNTLDILRPTSTIHPAPHFKKQVTNQGCRELKSDLSIIWSWVFLRETMRTISALIFL